MISASPGASKWFYEKTTSLHERFQKCEMLALDLERKRFPKEDYLNFSTKMNNPRELQEYWNKIVGDGEKSISRNQKIMDKLASIDQLLLSLGGKAVKLDLLRGEYINITSKLQSLGNAPPIWDPNAAAKSWPNQPASKAQLSQQWLESVSDSGFASSNPTDVRPKNYSSVCTQTENNIRCPHCSKDVFQPPVHSLNDGAQNCPNTTTPSALSHLESMFTDQDPECGRLDTAKSLALSQTSDHGKSIYTSDINERKSLEKKEISFEQQLDGLDLMPLSKSLLQRSYTLPNGNSKNLNDGYPYPDDSDRAPTRNYMSLHEDHVYPSIYTIPGSDSLPTGSHNYKDLIDSKIECFDNHDNFETELAEERNLIETQYQDSPQPIGLVEFLKNNTSNSNQRNESTCSSLEFSKKNDNDNNNRPDDVRFAKTDSNENFTAELSLSQEDISGISDSVKPYHQQLDFENGHIDNIEKKPKQDPNDHFIKTRTNVRDSEKYVDFQESSLEIQKSNELTEASKNIWKQGTSESNPESQIREMQTPKSNPKRSSLTCVTEEVSEFNNCHKVREPNESDSVNRQSFLQEISESEIITASKLNLKKEDSSRNCTRSVKSIPLPTETSNLELTEPIKSPEKQSQDTEEHPKADNSLNNDSSDESSCMDDVDDSFFDNYPPVTKKSSAYKALLGISVPHKESDSEDDIENSFTQSVLSKKNHETKIDPTSEVVLNTRTEARAIVEEDKHSKSSKPEKVKPNLSNQERERIKKKVLLLGEGFDSDLEDNVKPLPKSSAEVDDDFFD